MSFEAPINVLEYLQEQKILADVNSEVACITSINDLLSTDIKVRHELISRILPEGLRPSEMFSDDPKLADQATDYFIKYLCQELVKRRTKVGHKFILEAADKATLRTNSVVMAWRRGQFEGKPVIGALEIDNEDDQEPKKKKINDLKAFKLEIAEKIKAGIKRDGIMQWMIDMDISKITAQTYYYDVKANLKKEKSSEAAAG